MKDLQSTNFYIAQGIKDDFIINQFLKAGAKAKRRCLQFCNQK